MLNKPEHLKSAAMARQDKNAQELFANMLNEIKPMNTTCKIHGILDNTIG